MKKRLRAEEINITRGVNYDGANIMALTDAYLTKENIQKYRPKLSSYDQCGLSQKSGNVPNNIRQKYDDIGNDREIGIGHIFTRNQNGQEKIFVMANANINAHGLVGNIQGTDIDVNHQQNNEYNTQQLREIFWELDNFLKENPSQANNLIEVLFPIQVPGHWILGRIIIDPTQKTANVLINDSMVSYDWNNVNMKGLKDSISDVFKGSNNIHCSQNYSVTFAQNNPQQYIQKDSYCGGLVSRMMRGIVQNNDPYNWNDISNTNINCTNNHYNPLEARQDDVNFAGTYNKENGTECFRELYNTADIIRQQVRSNNIIHENLAQDDIVYGVCYEIFTNQEYKKEVVDYYQDNTSLCNNLKKFISDKSNNFVNKTLVEHLNAISEIADEILVELSIQFREQYTLNLLRKNRLLIKTAGLEEIINQTSLPELDVKLKEFASNNGNQDYAEQRSAKRLKTSNSLTTEHIILDNFARLIEGNSDCAALCYNENDEEGEILITSNKLTEGTKTAADYLIIKEAIKYFQKQDSPETRLQLFQDICLQRIAGEQGDIYYKGQARKRIKEVAKDVLDNSDKWKTLTAQEIATKFQLDLNRQRTIITQLQSAYAILSRTAHDFKKVEKGFKDNHKLQKAIIFKITDENKTPIFASELEIQKKSKVDNNKQIVHAELRIINNLFKEEYLTAEKIKEKLDKGENFYIGISKLCCTQCQHAIEATNETLAELAGAEYKGKEIIKYGDGSNRDTHGMTFEANWKSPDFMTLKVSEHRIRDENSSKSICENQAVNKEKLTVKDVTVAANDSLKLKIRKRFFLKEKRFDLSKPLKLKRPKRDSGNEMSDDEQGTVEEKPIYKYDFLDKENLPSDIKEIAISDLFNDKADRVALTKDITKQTKIYITLQVNGQEKHVYVGRLTDCKDAIEDLFFIHKFGIDENARQKDDYESQHATASASDATSPMRRNPSLDEEEERDEKLSHRKSEIFEGLDNIHKMLQETAEETDGIVTKENFEQLVKEHLKIADFKLESKTEQTSNYKEILQNVVNAIREVESSQNLADISLINLINQQYSENAQKALNAGMQIE
jgi:hypothetical protein